MLSSKFTLDVLIGNSICPKLLMLVSKHIQRMTFVQPKLAKVLLLAEIISTEV